MEDRVLLDPRQLSELLKEGNVIPSTRAIRRATSAGIFRVPSTRMTFLPIWHPPLPKASTSSRTSLLRSLVTPGSGERNWESSTSNRWTRDSASPAVAISS